MTPSAGVQNKEINTFFRNVNKMTRVGLKPTPQKWLVPQASDIPCVGVQNKGNNTFFRNVNKMIGVGLEPTPAK